MKFEMFPAIQYALDILTGFISISNIVVHLIFIFILNLILHDYILILCATNICSGNNTPMK